MMAGSLTVLKNRIAGSMTFPVLTKEMRSRMRGLRGPLSIFLVTGLTIFVASLILYWGWQETYRGYAYYHGYGNPMQRLPEIGRALFIGLVILEAALTALISPALTASSISLEREQQTLDFLLLTRLSSHNITLGKLLSSMNFLGMLLFCSLPVLAVCFWMGGVNPGQFFWALAIIASVGFLFGCIGLLCSSRFAKTSTSVVLSYVACLLWLGGVPLIIYLLMTLSQTSWSDLSFWYVVCFALLILLISVVPTLIISLVAGILRRRRLERLTNILIGGALMILLTLLFCFSGVGSNLYYSDDFIGLFLINNPVVAMMQIISPDDFMSGAPDLLTYSPWVCVGMNLFVGWASLLLTGRQLDRMRHD